MAESGLKLGTTTDRPAVYPVSPRHNLGELGLHLRLINVADAQISSE